MRAGSFPDHLRRILEPEYPRFSGAEMQRRRAAIERLLAEHDVDHLLYCGFNRTGSAVQWLTQWPVTAEAVGVLSPGKPDALFVQYFNHLPLARRLAEHAEVDRRDRLDAHRRRVERPRRHGAARGARAPAHRATTRRSRRARLRGRPPP